MRGEKPPMTFEEFDKPESFTERYERRVKENPFLTAGLVGLGGMLIAGARRFKKLRADGMSPSIFLINLRVAAQGMVAGALALGLMSQFAKEYIEESDNKKKQ